MGMALVTLKVVDATLVKVETLLKAVECDTAKTVSNYVKTIHDTANTLRIGAVKSAGTPLAKKIEDDTISESLMEVSGLQSVMERLGFVGGEVPEINKDVTEDAKVTDVTEDAKVPDVNTDVTEDAKVDVNTDATEDAKVDVNTDATEDVKVTDVTEDAKVKEESTPEKVVETPTEEPAVEKLAEEPVTKKTSSKKSKKGSKEATPVGDLM